MQLSASASLETIHRLYRNLAGRLHPDNAYWILSDVEKRPAFDIARGVR